MALQTPDIKEMKFAKDLNESQVEKMLKISTEKDPSLRYEFLKIIAGTISQRLSDKRLQLANVVTI